MNVVLISSSYDQLVTIVSELRECLILQEKTFHSITYYVFP